MGNNGANQYKQTSIKTASGPQVLIMLYEAAIQNLKKAQACIDKKDMAAKGTHIGKCHDIVNELMVTLNFEAGGQLAHDLEGLYQFISSSLLKANMENDKNLLAQLQKILENLLAGWRGAVEQVQKGQAK